MRSVMACLGAVLKGRGKRTNPVYRSRRARQGARARSSPSERRRAAGADNVGIKLRLARRCAARRVTFHCLAARRRDPALVGEQAGADPIAVRDELTAERKSVLHAVLLAVHFGLRGDRRKHGGGGRQGHGDPDRGGGAFGGTVGESSYWPPPDTQWSGV